MFGEGVNSLLLLSEVVPFFNEAQSLDENILISARKFYYDNIIYILSEEYVMFYSLKLLTQKTLTTNLNTDFKHYI